MPSVYQQTLEDARTRAAALPPVQPVNTAPTAPTFPSLPTITPSDRTPTAYQATLAGARAKALPVAPVNTPPSPTYDAAMGAAGTVLSNAASSVYDPASAVRGDVADAYQRGAAYSTPTGVGMAAREAVISPVSRTMGTAMNTGVAAAKAGYDAAAAVARPTYEGVRAFLTGRPPANDAVAPAVAPAAGAYAPEPTAQGTVPPSVANPVLQPISSPEVPPPEIPGVSTTPVTGTVMPRAGGGVQPIQPVFIQPPAPVSTVNAKRAGAGAGTIEGLLSTATGLRIAANENAQNQRAFKNTVGSVRSGMENAKIAGELTRLPSQIEHDQAAAEASRASTEHSRAETDKTRQGIESQKQIDDLKTKVANEADPKKRREYEEKLRVLMGKAQDKVQVVNVQVPNPDMPGAVINVPHTINTETGEVKAVAPQQQPNGMTYVGRSPDGKRVFQDAKGNKHVEG